MRRKAESVFIYAWLTLSLAGMAVISYRMQVLAHEQKKLKWDYFVVNQIKYGLLSGNQWSAQVNRIIGNQIDSFNLTSENKALLIRQTDAILYRLVDELNDYLHKEKRSFGDKIKFGILNALVDVSRFKEEVPRFSRAIVDEIDKSKNKKKIREMLKKKVTDILAATNQDIMGEQAFVLRKYGYDKLKPFNEMIAYRTELDASSQKVYGFMVAAILASVLQLWIFVLRRRHSMATAFLLSVLLSFLALYTGVSLPMIEIDARIAKLDLALMNDHIIFNEQVIFYQAKSILDVVRILVTNGKGDAVFVGFLILLFSVLFPTTKLICTSYYLYRHQRAGRFVKFMAFNSGKWSMADVMVVAIFMAYVGFKGILDNQLEDITTHTEMVNLITTNRTNLQPGYVVFVAFCLFNLILAEILKRITARRAAQRTQV